MTTDVSSQIQQLYVAFFGRPADAGGLAYWINSLTTGAASYESIAHQFWVSPEFQKTYAGMDNRSVINAMYHNLFARDGDTGGLDYWTGWLDNHTYSLDQIIAFITKSAQAPDQSILDAKVQVANAFTSHMDLASEQSAYLGSAGMQVGHDFMADVNSTGKAAFDLNTPGLIDSAIAQFAYPQHADAPQTVQLVGFHDGSFIA
jgi:hypothetical protein